MLTDSAGYADSSVTLLLALFGVGATAGNLLGGRLADHSMRGTLFGGLVSLVAVLALFPVLMGTAWSAALAVVLLGTAAFVTSSPLLLMVMEKASSAPSLASSANQAAFNLANAGGAWIGGLTLAAGFGIDVACARGRGAGGPGPGCGGASRTWWTVGGRRSAAGRVVAAGAPRQVELLPGGDLRSFCGCVGAGRAVPRRPLGSWWGGDVPGHPSLLCGKSGGRRKRGARTSRHVPSRHGDGCRSGARSPPLRRSRATGW